MPFLILLLFIAVPIVEIAVFIEVGGWIGLWPTIGIVILTAILGTAMLRQQGLSTLFRLRQKLEKDRLPVQEVFDGLCLLIAGALLLTPGFVTDSIGFLLFVPPFRHWLGRLLAGWIVARGDIHVQTAGFGGGPDGGPDGGPGRRPSDGGTVIDGEYDDVTPTDERGYDRLRRPGDDG